MMKKKTFFALIISVFICLVACSSKTYTVDFNTDGGSFIGSQTVKENEKVNRPTDPTKEGSTFKKWQWNNVDYDFDQPVKENMVLLAIYEEEENTCTVIIEGKTYTASFKDGEELTISDPVSKEGKVFAGWKVDGVKALLSEAKAGSVIEAIFEDARIPCTGLKTPYKSYYTVEGNGRWKLDVVVTPENTTDPIYYSSDDETIVKIDSSGKIYAGNVGNTKIHISCGDQKWTIDFETRAKKVDVTSVQISEDNVVLYAGNSHQLSAMVKPDNATDKTLTWVSSNTAVATVDSTGLVTAKGIGIATITATAANGQSAYCTVGVEGETVIFTMQNNVSVKAGSGEKIPYKATHISCYDWTVNSQDVTEWVDFHTAYTSALDIDGYGNVYAKGAVYETVDIPVYFTYSDGSSFFVTSPTFTVHVEK